MTRARLPEPVCLTRGPGTNKHPRLLVDRRNRLWLAWQRSVDGRDSVVVTCLRDNFVVFEQEFSNFGSAYRPVMCEDAAGRIIVAWSEVGAGGANVFLTSIVHGQQASAVAVSTGGSDVEPALAADESGVWVAYHSFRRGKASVFLRRFRDGWSDELEVTPGMEAYRPALVALGGGRVRVYFDAYAGGRYDVHGAESDGATVGAPVRISSGGTWCHTPVAVPDGRGGAPDGRGGAVVAWQGIGTDKYVCYDMAVDGRTERVASLECVHTSCDVCASADAVWLTWRISGSVFLMRRLDRATGSWWPALAIPKSGAYCRRPATAVDRRGNVWLAWQSPPAGEERFSRRADIYLQRVTPEFFGGMADPSLAVHAYAGEAGHEMVPLPDAPRFEASGGARVWFGELHAHCCFSDGLGTHDQFYNAARDLSGLDFGAVVEHVEFPDELTAPEWRLGQLVAEVFNEPGRFVTIVGHEWASNEVGLPYGHKNIYFPGRAGELLCPKSPSADTPERLFGSARRLGAIVVPHHVSVRWGATDWDHHDPDVQRLCEIASHHGIMEYDGNPRAHVDPPVPGCSVQAALARGYRLGLIAGSDTHRLAPGRDGGVAAVVCGQLTRDEVFAALRQRRCYASTGPRLLVDFGINGHGMGQEVDLARLGGPVAVGFRIRADCRVVAVEVVRNNEAVHREEADSPEASAEWRDPAAPTAGTYYYLRIELGGGEFAWSSPIWVV